MASQEATDEMSAAIPSSETQNDPFITTTSATPGSTHPLRYSTFDSQLFALGPDASPAQAKRALEAHLAETDRRMEEAGKLGTALLQQRQELTDRLQDVEKLQAEGEISQGLREKLLEVEKDYNEVARESARAFLPKQRVLSSEAAAGIAFVPEGKGGRRSVSPSKFEAQATGSPTKFSVPNRKIRNQPTNRNHDEFYAEITTSLIAQVRSLQSLIVEKDDELRDLKVEKSRLEYEAEGFQHRVRTLDESESRYKDENWNLETQVHELTTKEQEAVSREKKLTQTLNVLQAEKGAVQRELDEVKVSHAKLTEEHTAAVKQNDIEIGTARRNIIIAESERVAMQRRIEDLTGQNTELAKAVSASQRARILERESILGMSDEDFETAHDRSTPEHSPPPSPIKGTPRHSMLESETLKTSLGHAQRTIQGLRNNVHREKTEKLELRRMLQEARDELDKVRGDPLASNRRARKTESREFKKPPRLLGGLRGARSEIFADDPNWEDQAGAGSDGTPSTATQGAQNFEPVSEQSDHFDTANETSDAAFETANERATETDDFHTGAEEFSSDSVETETESPSKRRTIIGLPSGNSSFGLTRSASFHSTASTEDEAYPFENEKRTPTSFPQLQHKFQLRVSRGAFRRSRQASEEPTLQSSPASFANSSVSGTPQPMQSLAAELGDFDGSDNESNLSTTPSRRATRGHTTSPPPPMPSLPSRLAMVDSGTMTEPMSSLIPNSPVSIVGPERPISIATLDSRLSMSDYSDSGMQDIGEKLAKFPSPPTSPPRRDFVLPPELALSNIHAHEVEPVPEPDTHATEIAAIRASHAEELAKVSGEHLAAQAAALEALKSQHADDISQHEAEVKVAHAQELDTLRSRHAESARRAADEAQAALAKELDLVKSSHADRISEVTAEAQEIHLQELDAIRASHTEVIAQKEAENKASFASELAALKALHATELADRETKSQAAHEAELEALRVSHAKELSDKEAQSRITHADELENLQASHVKALADKESESKSTYLTDLELIRKAHAQELADKEAHGKSIYSAELEALQTKHNDDLSATRKGVDDAHAAEFEALRLEHAKELSTSRDDSESSRAAEIANLRRKHDDELSTLKKDSDAAFASELESLQSKHRDELDAAKHDSDAARAAEIATLIAAHAEHIEHSKKELGESHSKDLETLKSSYVQQIDQSKQESDAVHARDLEALKVTHLRQIDEARNNIVTAHIHEIENLKAAHDKQLEDSKNASDDAHATEIAALVASHGKTLESVRAESEVALSRELATLKEAHGREIDSLNAQHAAARAEELESFKTALNKQIESSKFEGDAAHSQQIEALNAAHSEILDAHKRESEQAQAQALESLKHAHEVQIDALKSENAFSKSKELEGLSTKHAQELEALRLEHLSLKTSLKDELSTTHQEELENLRRDLKTSKADEISTLAAAHAQELAASKTEQEAERARMTQELASAHSLEIERLRQENEAARAEAAATSMAMHAKDLESLRNKLESSHVQKLQELKDLHSSELENLQRAHGDSKSKELAAISDNHHNALEHLRTELAAFHEQKLRELSDVQARELDDVGRARDDAKAKELAALAASHDSALERLKTDLEAARLTEAEELRSKHAASLAAMQSEHQSSLDSSLANLKAELEAVRLRESDELNSKHTASLGVLRSEHQNSLDASLANLKAELDAARSREAEELKSTHAASLVALRSEHQNSLDASLTNLKAEHAEAVDTIKKDHDVRQTEALDALVNIHAQQLDQLRIDSDAALAQELDAAKANYASVLESQRRENEGEKNKLLADHALELETLRQSLAIVPPPLGISSVNSIHTEPIEVPEPRSPKREAFIIPQDREPHTPGFGKKGRGATTTIIAEDDTRQSPSNQRDPETPESQRPFKEISTNTDARPSRKQPVDMSNQGSQTALTSDGLDQLLDNQRDKSQGSLKYLDEPPSPSGSVIRIRRSSIDSQNSVIRVRRIGEHGAVAAAEAVPARRPGSSGSTRAALQNLPPLPPNHREVIEAARTGSSHGGKGTMGPPLLPASAYRSPTSRSETPDSRPPISPLRGPPTPRAGRTPGYADVQSTTRVPYRSRQSSVSSFASEIDNRFGIHHMGGEPAGFGPNTDPRMIQAITQTMIGEFLWKYTRKAGRGEISENRHRRYFWVHPYTRTLYWSDRDPSTAGRAELKAKSVPIEAVRVVADDNPMPPGLHRKSLVIISPGRTIKFTCTTGQRHETWFNALSYLLLRTGDEHQTDAEEVAGGITQEDVDEFSPPVNQRPINGTRPLAPPSLSSYNSRTTRNESPNIDVSMSIPTLTPTRERAPPRPRTIGRISGYFSSTLGSSFSSRRGRRQDSYTSAIYEASEVHDSAEDLRQMIEQQNNDSDRLENVRACCDGKHDVGSLAHRSKRGRLSNVHSHTHTHPGSASAANTPSGTVRTRA